MDALIIVWLLCETTRMGPKNGATGDGRESRPLPKLPVSLRSLGEFLDLSPATISLVLNNSPVARTIPQHTKDRIFSAAKRFNYRPNFVARSLRARHSYILGVVVPDVSSGYAAVVLSGIEDHLFQEGYFYIVVSHRHKTELIDRYPNLLLERSVEGIIAVDTPCRAIPKVPVAAVSGRFDVEGVTNIALDHDRAAALALEHLVELGHKRIAVMKGRSFSSDTKPRWDAFLRQAERLGIAIVPNLTVQLEGSTPSPGVGYVAVRKLLSASEPFTALMAFNDVSAIGAIRGLREAGLRVPEDVSVVGFDDIPFAAYQNPALTTVRQPLWEMGKLAAKTVLSRIASGSLAPYPKILTVQPELIVRETTCPVSPRAATRSKRPTQPRTARATKDARTGHNDELAVGSK